MNKNEQLYMSPGFFFYANYMMCFFQVVQTDLQEFGT